MKQLAYLILAHADPVHLARLVQALGDQADIYVHIDAKSSVEQFRAALIGTKVQFVMPRIRVAWAGISIVNATLSLMRAAIASNNKYHHIILLSGADYPLLNYQDILHHFQANPNRESIRYIDMRESKNHYMRQINQCWFKEPWFSGQNHLIQKLDKVVRKLGNWLALPNKWPLEIVPYFGSQWWALTPECVSYILKVVDSNPDYLRVNRFTFSPDEHFFHTLVGNSNFAENATGLESYREGRTYLLANLHLLHHSLQKWYTIDDWNEIASSKKAFVRKVSTLASEDLLDRIDKELLKI